MVLEAHPTATAPVIHFVNDLQHQINPANPAVDLGPKGQGSERRRKRELEKARRIKDEDAQRKRNMAAKPSTTDILFDDWNTELRVYAFRIAPENRIGTIKELGEKFVLFDNAGNEVSERARARDLKKAAAGLYVATEAKMSRQVRRRLERKGW